MIVCFSKYYLFQLAAARTTKLKLVQMEVLKMKEVLTLTSAQAPLLAAAD